ncbi:hypothetical protein [Comamonas sp. 4034]|uniref:hypothetical protein n=1 Tax=Comamonas sp. 4034 TaxID=3156455 RepID=UPI003D19F243
MTSAASIRKRGYALMGARIQARKLEDIVHRAINRTVQRFFGKALGLSLVLTFPNRHQFKAGEYASRCGDDVQQVTYASADGVIATFKCVKAPASGWCSVGDEEENLQRRYVLLNERDLIAMGVKP